MKKYLRSPHLRSPPKAYSPNLLEGKFTEVRYLGE
jgi:hypothetical protein